MTYNTRDNEGYSRKKTGSAGTPKSAYEIRCDLINLAIQSEAVNLADGEKLDPETIVKTAGIFNEFISKRSE